MVRGRFSWFQVVFSWFFVVPGHLKGQLDPPIGTNGGWLDPPVGNVTFLHQMMVGYLWFHVGFHGSRLVIFGSMWVFMVFHGSRLINYGSIKVFVVSHCSRLVFHGFSPKYTRPNCILAC